MTSVRGLSFTETVICPIDGVANPAIMSIIIDANRISLYLILFYMF